MPIIIDKGWAKWLKDHETNSVYDADPEAVTKLCNSTDSVQNFEDVSKCKNIVLLTKSPMGAKLQLSFYHSVVGICIIPDKLHYVARIGYDAGIGIEMDPKSTFRLTSTVYVPTIIEMMKVTNAEEFGNLVGNTEKPKRKLKKYSVLTPAIANAVEVSEKTPICAFIAVVKYLKTTMPASGTSEAVDEGETIPVVIV